jgi:Domain of unknown function (DUF1851)
MTDLGPFMRVIVESDVALLRTEWNWLVPANHQPLLITIFGDWVCGAPDGSHWSLSNLEGTYLKIAESSAEFNLRKKSFEFLDEHFIAGWQEIAERHGFKPDSAQCVGWRIPPVLGGQFEVENLQLFSMVVYQSIMGQLHRQLQGYGSREV